MTFGTQNRSLLFAGISFVLVVLFLSTLPGCGKEEGEGVTLVVQKEDTGDGIPENESYPDGFLTPSEIQIGLKSAKLILSDETSPSYTIFDITDPARPLRLDLDTTPETVWENSINPTGCPCIFSKIQFEITFVDMTIPTYVSGLERLRRVRFYTMDLPEPDPFIGFTVQKGDILMGDNEKDLDFNWVALEDGDFIRLSATRPDETLLQVPPARFPDDEYSAVVTVDLEPLLEIPEDSEGDLFTITATFQTGNLFVYDETDPAGPENLQFNLLTDGLLNSNDPNSRYSPTFPEILAAP